MQAQVIQHIQINLQTVLILDTVALLLLLAVVEIFSVGQKTRFIRPFYLVIEVLLILAIYGGANRG